MKYSAAAGIEPSLIMELDALAKEMALAGKRILNLSAGEPIEAAAPAGKEGALQAVRQDFSGYTAASGAPFMKEAAARFLGTDSAHVTVSAGAKPLVNAALRCAAGPGDEILIPVPCYPSFYEMALLTGAAPVLVQGTGPLYKLTERDLLGAVTPRTAALILNNPNNPTGALYSREELEPLVDICRQRGIWCVGTRYTGGLCMTGSPLYGPWNWRGTRAVW